MTQEVVVRPVGRGWNWSPRSRSFHFTGQGSGLTGLSVSARVLVTRLATDRTRWFQLPRLTVALSRVDGIAVDVTVWELAVATWLTTTETYSTVSVVFVKVVNTRGVWTVQDTAITVARVPWKSGPGEHHQGQYQRTAKTEHCWNAEGNCSGD